MSNDENLKIAYVGNFDQGVEAVWVDPPRVAVDGDFRQVGVRRELLEALLPDSERFCLIG